MAEICKLEGIVQTHSRQRREVSDGNLRQYLERFQAGVDQHLVVFRYNAHCGEIERRVDHAQVLHHLVGSAGLTAVVVKIIVVLLPNLVVVGKHKELTIEENGTVIPVLVPAGGIDAVLLLRQLVAGDIFIDEVAGLCLGEHVAELITEV